LVEAAAKFCAACGVNQDAARYEAEMHRQEEVREQIRDLTSQLNGTREVVQLLEIVVRTGKKRFSEPRFKELAPDYVPEGEPLGCWLTGLGLFVLYGLFSAILYQLFPYFSAVWVAFLFAVVAIAFINRQIKRSRRRENAKDQLLWYRSRMSELDEQIRDLQSTLP
jgi:hypothetical protein